MKYLWSISLILFLLGASLSDGYGHVFILVDVSGNPLQAAHLITPQMRQEALALTHDLLLNCFTWQQYPQWSLSGNVDPVLAQIVARQGRPLIQAGEYLLIMPYGERDTYLNYKINYIENFPTDVDRYFQFPFVYDQQQTFGELARAKAADVAAEAQIKEYYLIFISGLGEDTDSAPYTAVERQYLDRYQSSVAVQSLGIFRYQQADVDFKIEISKINIAKMLPPATGAGAPAEPLIRTGNVDQPMLALITPLGTKNQPCRFSTNHVFISWRCLGCETASTFTLRLTDLENNTTRSIWAGPRRNYEVTLEPGAYKVSVSNATLMSKPQYFEIRRSKTGSSLLIGLVGIGLLGLLYWLIREIRPKPHGTRRHLFEDDAAAQTENRNQPPAPKPPSDDYQPF